MNIKNQLNALLEEYLEPTFECYSDVLEEHYNGANKETHVVFTSVKKIVEDENLLEFFQLLKSNKIVFSSDNKKKAKLIFNDFYQIGNLTSFKRLKVIWVRVTLAWAYPTGILEFDYTISLRLENLREFCIKLLRQNRSEFKYRSIHEKRRKTNKIVARRNLLKFMTEENYRNFIDLLENKLVDDVYINWTGSIHELHYFIKLLCVDNKIINLPGLNKHWHFASAYFKINGEPFVAQKIKDGEVTKITADNKKSLTAIINNLL